ncbi:DUF447 family protein [Halorussus gelatinilyticus]|uniref:DUF447 family protein n=1 Tax=Halorussus gelatinilyticus TaxID=2937524 RepID=A0A8U0IMH8_9EURY|nr:DUF447 domain-containing protein [Halorussus gelatinilyticus]UPW02360.1 DUF447 family protein [Halorussus gelatinilyticus]
MTESLVTTLGPNDLWNVAALGLHPPAERDGENDGQSDGENDARGDGRVTARTWGNTRTRRNFHRQGGGYVQFVRDPVDFVDATLSIFEVEEPVLDSADAWVEVEVERVDSGAADDTEWEAWTLTPVESGVERETVPTINRGIGAVVEATVAASRLGVDAYDQSELRERLSYFEAVGRNCGDDRVRTALDRLRDHLDE